MPAAMLVALALAASPSTARYELLSGGRVTGALVRSEGPSRTVRVELAFVENGRGPKLVETIRLDAAGGVVAHELTGTSTFGSKVDERFTRDGKRAAWKTTADEGTQEVVGPAVYLPLVSTPESGAVALRAALAGGGRRGDVYFPSEIYPALGVAPFVEAPAIRLPSGTKTAAAGR